MKWIDVYILLTIPILLGFGVICFSFVYIIFKENNLKQGLSSVQNIISQCSLLYPLYYITTRLIHCFIREPNLPLNGKVFLGNCTVYLAKVPYRLTKKRLQLEIIAYTDLYYHSIKKQQYLNSNFNSKYYTAISEEAYLQFMWLLRSKKDLSLLFKEPINQYLPLIRWCSNTLQQYNPKDSSCLFFSME
jgi:hypothetical protein